MNKRNADILHYLQQGEQSTGNLALLLGAPMPSIRRSIVELRKEGHNITHADNHSLYRLGV